MSVGDAMSGEFPMFRLVTMLARQVSSPIAARIKSYARGHPGLSSELVRQVARAVHAADLRLRLWSLHAPQPLTLPPLSDRAALDYGADILGEAIVFSLGSLIVIFEVNRQLMKAEDKVLAEQSAWYAVRLQLEELRREVELQQQDLERMHEALEALARDRSAPDAPAPAPGHLAHRDN